MTVTEREKIENNPNIGALGRADYQEANRRVKGFCPTIITSLGEYISHLESKVLPVVESHPETSRVIDRAIMKKGLVEVGQNLDSLTVEAVVRLGGDWDGFSWIMSGTNFQGRILSQETIQKIKDLARNASLFAYEPTRNLPQDFSIVVVKENHLSTQDFETLAAIFRASFSDYISDLFSAENVKNWTEDPSTYPVVVRNPDGNIVAVTNGDLGEFTLQEKTFKFLEIGDSASNPDYRNMGLNRLLKSFLIREGKKLGFNSIHAETRACWSAPNFANAKNGMVYCGTLLSNCKIRGPEDIPESSDPQLADWARFFGSLNVWAVTPAYTAWSQY